MPVKGTCTARSPSFAGSLPGRLLGIDAGGSSTRAVVLEGGEVTELPAAPPMNALLTGNMLDLLQEIIRAAGATAVGDLGGPPRAAGGLTARGGRFYRAEAAGEPEQA